jgi:hypothetical protein
MPPQSAIEHIADVEPSSHQWRLWPTSARRASGRFCSGPTVRVTTAWLWRDAASGRLRPDGNKSFALGLDHDHDGGSSAFTVDAISEVDELPMQEDPEIDTKAKHQRAPSATITVVMRVESSPDHRARRPRHWVPCRVRVGLRTDRSISCCHANRIGKSVESGRANKGIQSLDGAST